MSERVLTTIEDYIATVTLNRADKKNAADLEMLSALIATGNSLATERNLRAVVLRGAGGNFCAGIDVSMFSGTESLSEQHGRMQPQPDTAANFFQSAALVWRDLPVPVIAVLEGCTFGAGFQVAMGADIRFGGRDLKLSIMEVKWGVIPDMGITVTMPRLVAEDKVRQLAYTGRIVAAQEALDIGVITELVDDPAGAAQDVARDIAAKSPDAVRAIKHLFNNAWDDKDRSSLRLEADLQCAVMAGDNHREAALANVERRAAKFKDVT